MKFASVITLSALFGVAVSVKMNRVSKLAQLRQGPGAKPDGAAAPSNAEDGSVPTSFGWECTWAWEDLHAVCVDGHGTPGDENSCHSKGDACHDGSGDTDDFWYNTDKGGDDSQRCGGEGTYWWDSNKDGSGKCQGFAKWFLTTDEDGNDQWDEGCMYFNCDGHDGGDPEDDSDDFDWTWEGQGIKDDESHIYRARDSWTGNDTGSCSGFNNGLDEEDYFEYYACSGQDNQFGPYDTEEIFADGAFYWIDHAEGEDAEWESEQCHPDDDSSASSGSTGDDLDSDSSSGTSDQEWECEIIASQPDQDDIDNSHELNKFAW